MLLRHRRGGLQVPPSLSRQPDLAAGLTFRYTSIDGSRVAWSRAGPLFGVLKTNASFVATEGGWAIDDPGDTGGGFEFVQTGNLGSIHPAQTVGLPVSMELIWNLDSYASNNSIASTSNRQDVYNGCTVRTGNGDIQVNLGTNAGTTSSSRRTWEFNSTTFSTGTTYHFIFTIFGVTDGIFMLDGAETTPSNAGTGSASNPNIPHSSASIQILGKCEGAGGAADGRVLMMNVWQRQLTRAEMRKRFADPFGLFYGPQILTADGGGGEPAQARRPIVIAVSM